MIKIYGIKNCDAMKKAFKWLDAENIAYEFHDYKKHGVDDAALRQAIAQHGWNIVINQRGTTWRKLPEDVRSTMSESSAIAVAHENPSIIKRPLLVQGDNSIVGFKDDVYREALKP